jgi:hypothetical protein
MQHSLLAERRHPLAHLVRKLPQLGTAFIFHLLFIAPTLLSFFRRPNITRQLCDGLTVEIENLKGSPGLSYCRFYNQDDIAFLPHDLMCIDLVALEKLQNMNDRHNRPAFLLCDASWYALCNREVVFAYVHSTGTICLPSEVVSYLSFFFLSYFLIL